jgi:NitT/TauT family transport system substrate-binding protein
VAKGYYGAAGLKVNFDYAQTSDVISLVGAGRIAFGDAEPDQVIVGASHGLPIVSVFTQYQRFPVVIFSLASSDIHNFANLKGKTIGIPARYGASWTGLQAALQAAHLSTSDVKIAIIGYTQAEAVAQHRVDAAVGYAMNEPVQLKEQGLKVTVLPIAGEVPLGGPGVVASTPEIARDPGLVRRFVQATLLGQRDTNANPTAAFTLSRSFMPGIPSAQLRYQLDVLKVAVSYWTPAKGHGLGCSDLVSWKATEQVLLQQHQISAPVKVSPLFTNKFIGHC